MLFLYPCHVHQHCLVSLLPHNPHFPSIFQQICPLNQLYLTNLTGYPAMAQNHAHNPSAFRQAYQDNSVFHHSLLSMGYSHPQYKTGASRRNFPLSDVNISGYGGFGSAANFPGAILQAAASAGSAGGHDFLLSQHQERNDFTTLHQVRTLGFPLFLYKH